MTVGAKERIGVTVRLTTTVIGEGASDSHGDNEGPKEKHYQKQTMTEKILKLVSDCHNTKYLHLQKQYEK